MDNDTLIARARAVLNPRKLSPMAEAGGVGSALLTSAGNVYVGVCVDTMAAGIRAERVLLPGGASATLADLLPHHWWRGGDG